MMWEDLSFATMQLVSKFRDYFNTGFVWLAEIFDKIDRAFAEKVVLPILDGIAKIVKGFLGLGSKLASTVGIDTTEMDMAVLRIERMQKKMREKIEQPVAAAEQTAPMISPEIPARPEARPEFKPIPVSVESLQTGGAITQEQIAALLPQPPAVTQQPPAAAAPAPAYGPQLPAVTQQPPAAAAKKPEVAVIQAQNPTVNVSAAAPETVQNITAPSIPPIVTPGAGGPTEQTAPQAQAPNKVEVETKNEIKLTGQINVAGIPKESSAEISTDVPGSRIDTNMLGVNP